jgi:hypothetical protein
VGASSEQGTRRRRGSSCLCTASLHLPKFDRAWSVKPSTSSKWSRGICNPRGVTLYRLSFHYPANEQPARLGYSSNPFVYIDLSAMLRLRKHLHIYACRLIGWLHISRQKAYHKRLDASTSGVPLDCVHVALARVGSSGTRISISMTASNRCHRCFHLAESIAATRCRTKAACKHVLVRAYYDMLGTLQPV